jgi:outer membrane lipoprotein-sorting protein
MDILKISIFLIIFPILLSAQNADKIKAEIVSFYENVETYEAKFEQINFWSGANLSKTSKGTLYFNHDKLLLCYEEPDNQMLIVENQTVIMYDQNSNQAIISGEMDIPLRPAEIVEHFWDNALEIVSETKQDSLFITLKTQKNEHIEMKFYQKKLMRLQITDGDKNEVTYKFQTIYINKPIKKEILEYELPEDAQFIDTRNR